MMPSIKSEMRASTCRRFGVAVTSTLCLLAAAPAMAQSAYDPGQQSVEVNWGALDQLRGGTVRPETVTRAPEPYVPTQPTSARPTTESTVAPRAARPLPMTNLQLGSPPPVMPRVTENPAAEPARVAVATAAPAAPVQQPEPEPDTTAQPPEDNDLLMRLAFQGQSEELSATAMQQLAQLANRMNGLAGRLQVRSYAAPTDASSSSARKLSFKRALAVRSYLIEKGVRSTRVDLRALGPADDGGIQDRVDIILTTG